MLLTVHGQMTQEHLRVGGLLCRHYAPHDLTVMVEVVDSAGLGGDLLPLTH